MVLGTLGAARPMVGKAAWQTHNERCSKKNIMHGQCQIHLLVDSLAVAVWPVKERCPGLDR